MCIAILNIKKEIKETTLQNCWTSNPDGGGILWIDNKELKTFKTLIYEEYVNMYQKIRKETKLPIVLHFRIGTSGTNDLTNVHPFFVNDSLAFVHNGIMNLKVPQGSIINDTQIFNNYILKSLPKNFLRNYGTKWLIEYFLGTGNKLIFLDKTGKYTIINENIGHWSGDNWYSNNSYKDTPVFSYFGKKNTQINEHDGYIYCIDCGEPIKEGYYCDWCNPINYKDLENY